MVLVVAAVSCRRDVLRERPAQSDAERIQGKWRMVSIDGEALTEAQLIYCIFDGPSAINCGRLRRLTGLDPPLLDGTILYYRRL